MSAAFFARFPGIINSLRPILALPVCFEVEHLDTDSFYHMTLPWQPHELISG